MNAKTHEGYLTRKYCFLIRTFIKHQDRIHNGDDMYMWLEKN